MLRRTFDVHSPVEMFRGFLTACHLALDDLPYHLHYAVTGHSVAPPGRQEHWDHAMGRFSPQTVEAFAHGFAVLLEASHFLPKGETYDSAYGPDIIGAVYMDLLSGISQRWNYLAQYFTPWPVAWAMAQLTAHDLAEKVGRRIKREIAGDPYLEAVTLTAGLVGQGDDQDGAPLAWWLARAWPRIRQRLQPVVVADPCVGSAILLLAVAAGQPLWMSHLGAIRYLGADTIPCASTWRA